MGLRGCNGITCKQVGESCKGWQLTNRMFCRECDKSFSPENVKSSPSGRNICPCCGGFVRSSSRSAGSKRRKTELKKLEISNTN